MEKETRKTPPVRFKGFTDDWEQRKLSKIYGKIRNAFVGTATPYYVDEGHFYLESNNVKNGTINKSSQVFINNEFYYKQKDKWLHTGDMVMVQSGHVGQSAVIPKDLDNTAAHALIMFQNPQVDIAPYFLNAQYQTNTAKRKIDNITKGNTIKHILASDMEKFIVSVTSLAEQHKIAGLFQNIDNRIALYQRKCEQMKQAKKYFLQNMFPRKGETVPRIRFKGFTDAWEQRKLGDIMQESLRTTDNFTDNPLYSLTIQDGITPKTVRYERGYLVQKKESIFKIVEPMFFVTNPMNLRFGAFGYNKNDYPISVSGYYDVFSIDNNQCNAFWYAYFKTPEVMKQFDNIATGSLMEKRRVKYSTLKKLSLLSPKTIEERKKISSFFDNLYNRITLHQQKYEQLQQLKKFFLQNLFV